MSRRERRTPFGSRDTAGPKCLLWPKRTLETEAHSSAQFSPGEQNECRGSGRGRGGSGRGRERGRRGRGRGIGVEEGRA